MLATHTKTWSAATAFAFLLTSGAVTLDAQLPLEPAATIGTAQGPNAVLLADLDRDGDLDAVVAAGPDGTGGEIVFFPRTGGGWGAAQTIEASFAFAKDLVAVDLDRDGDLDVAAVSFQDDELAWWENSLGDASSWSAKKTIDAAADGAVALEAGDVDGDGDPDLVACSRVAGAVRWYENDGTPGDGGWTTRSVNAAAFTEATALDLADVDRDGDLDVVVAGRSAGELAWWANDGSGLSWTKSTITTGLVAPRDLVLADLDRDGALDIAAVSGSRLVELNGTGGAWSAPVEIADFAGARHLRAVDLDLDGRLDLLSASVDEDRLVWWRNSASGWAEHEIDISLAGARGVDAADVDRDGDLDIVATSFSGDSVLHYENRPIHRRASFEEVLVTTDFAEAAIAVDVDADGDLDIVGGGPLAWYERAGESFVATHVIDSFTGLTGGQLVHVAAADVDGDGDLDFAGGNSFRQLWWENDGSPADDVGGGLGTSWTRHPVSDGHSQLQGTSIVDLDRDGALDLLAFDLAGDQVLWWRSDGSPADGVGGDGNSWTEGVIDGVTDSPRAALPRDVDRDGDLDVIVISQLSSPTASWWRNDSGATSWSQQTIGTGTPTVAAAEDVDGDGDLDVFAGFGGSAGGAVLGLYRQSPGPTWGSPPEQIGGLTDQFFFNELAAADLDLDGDTDVVGVGDRDRTYWWRNPGAVGGWPREDVSIDQFRADGLRVEEADGDALPDLVVPSLAASKIVIWHNRAAQAQLIGSEMAGISLQEGGLSALLRINAVTLGTVTDNQAEIAALELFLEETPGDPLSDAEASAILEELRFYEDIDDSGDLDPMADTLIGTLVAPSPVAGGLRFELPDFAATIGSTSFRSYFLAAELTGDALSQGVESLRVTLRTAESRMEDAFYDTPLVLLDPEDVSTPVLPIEDPLFEDGFETGNTSAWSATVP